MMDLNFLVAGVGGQGTLLASDILAEVGMRAGHDVKKSDVLGLAIRGGSVLSHVRWGEKVASPVVREGGMDYMLAFEPLEAMRGTYLLKPTSILVCNTQPVAPISVSSGDARYPSHEEIKAALECAAGTVHFVDATAEAIKLGNTKATNILMLGTFSVLCDVAVEIWEDVILKRVPKKYVKLNKDAFHMGQTLIRERRTA